jgi:hypothetical protein
MSKAMKWERVKVKPADQRKNKQPSAVFRAKGPKGWIVAIEWGEGNLRTLYVPGDKWDVELDE